MLQAYYKTDENQDFTLVDSVGNIGDATLGDVNGYFAPLWANVISFETIPPLLTRIVSTCFCDRNGIYNIAIVRDC